MISGGLIDLSRARMEDLMAEREAAARELETSQAELENLSRELSGADSEAGHARNDAERAEGEARGRDQALEGARDAGEAYQREVGQRWDQHGVQQHANSNRWNSLDFRKSEFERLSIFGHELVSLQKFYEDLNSYGEWVLLMGAAFLKAYRIEVGLSSNDRLGFDRPSYFQPRDLPGEEWRVEEEQVAAETDNLRAEAGQIQRLQEDGYHNRKIAKAAADTAEASEALAAGTSASDRATSSRETLESAMQSQRARLSAAREYLSRIDARMRELSRSMT